MKTKQKLASAFTALTLVLNLSPLRSVQAADGDLDTTFSFDGKVTTSFGHEAVASDVAIDDNGKIVVVGNGDTNAGLARYNGDGTLDGTFGTNGKVTSAFAGGNSRVFAMAIDAAGKIVVTGYAYDGTSQNFAVARFNGDGSADGTFGTGGYVTTDFVGGYDGAWDIAIDGNGKLIVAGFSSDGTKSYFALARYNGDGSLDSGFGTGGKVTTDLGAYGAEAHALVIDANGKIVVVGRASLELFGFRFALARYNGDGSLDSDFGGNGKVISDFSGAFDEANAVAIDGNGKIVAGGRANVGGKDRFGVARYQADGNLDGSFGTGGKVTTEFPYSGEILGIAIDAKGKVVVAGTSWDGLLDGTGYDIALARYNGDGSLDGSFGSGGKVTTDFYENHDAGRALAIDWLGKIIVAGAARQDSLPFDNNFALARYLSSSVPPCSVKCPANANQANDSGQCGALVSYPVPPPRGSCVTAIECTPASGSFFPIGTTTVSCTDNAAVECSFTVTVHDTQPPTIACPSDLTVAGTSASGVVVNYPAPAAADNCAGVTVSCIPASGAVFPVGTTTVTCAATDASSNATSCTFSVLVERADLAISKIAAVSKVSPGQNITYTINAQNVGPGNARDVVISDPVPANCSFVSATGPVSFAPGPGANGTVIWSYSSLASGATRTVTMTVRVSAKGKNAVSNTATISSPSFDPVPANNSATVSTRLPVQGK